MITSIHIENFKSIQSLDMELGRLNVFIGANGSGKSNILEAIAMGIMDVEENLEDEFLVNRGIRVSEPKLMKCAFLKENLIKETTITFSSQEYQWYVKLSFDEGHYSGWISENSIKNKLKLIESEINGDLIRLNELTDNIDHFNEIFDELNSETIIDKITAVKNADVKELVAQFSKNISELKALNTNLVNFKKTYDDLQPVVKKINDFSNFTIYAPENHFLRRFEEEAAIKPLGIKGEGLFKLITIIAEEYPDQFNKIKNHLKLIDWFEDFEIPGDLKFTERRIKIKDQYLADDLQYFDQRSANEGFLYLLFYLTLFVSDLTPHFFAIDNIDNSLNPKLGSELIKVLSKLSKDHNKQALLTTHNPVILDGLDLKDEDQRLFVVYRNADGHTKVRRIQPQHIQNGIQPVRLSEAFIRGYIGGLPDNF